MTIEIRRLKKRADFLRVAGQNTKWVTPSLVVQVAPQSGDTDSQNPYIGVGFTASRKVGNAVKRNRAKRRMRALASEILPAQGQAGHDLVFIARRAMLERDFDTVRADTQKALKKLGVLSA